MFDTVGRTTMIAATYILSVTLLYATGLLFAAHRLDATTVTLCRMLVLFFASAGASAAYLAASEIFPLEVRALAIAVVFGAGTLIGGAYAPSFFGALIATKSVPSIVYGYTIAAAMMAGRITAAVFGIVAERKSLESIARPLSTVRSGDALDAATL